MPSTGGAQWRRRSSQAQVLWIWQFIYLKKKEMSKSRRIMRLIDEIDKLRDELLHKLFPDYQRRHSWPEQPGLVIARKASWRGIDLDWRGAVNVRSASVNRKTNADNHKENWWRYLIIARIYLTLTNQFWTDHWLPKTFSILFRDFWRRKGEASGEGDAPRRRTRCDQCCTQRSSTLALLTLTQQKQKLRSAGRGAHGSS